MGRCTALWGGLLVQLLRVVLNNHYRNASILSNNLFIIDWKSHYFVGLTKFRSQIYQSL